MLNCNGREAACAFPLLLTDARSGSPAFEAAMSFRFRGLSTNYKSTFLSIYLIKGEISFSISGASIHLQEHVIRPKPIFEIIMAEHAFVQV